MTTRRFLHSSVFLALALVAAHVPACEYGSNRDDSMARLEAQPLPAADVIAPADATLVSVVPVPLAPHA